MTLMWTEYTTLGISKDRVSHILHEIWAWETPSAWWVFSLQTTSVTVPLLYCLIFLSAVRKSCCIVLLSSTKLGFISTILGTIDFTRWKSSNKKSIIPVGKVWPPFSGIHKVSSTSTTWRRKKRYDKLLVWFDAELQKNGTILFPYPAYSPDLAPCFFFLFLNMKSQSPGRNFSRIRRLSLPILQTFRTNIFNMS